MLKITVFPLEAYLKKKKKASMWPTREKNRIFDGTGIC